MAMNSFPDSESFSDSEDSKTPVRMAIHRKSDLTAVNNSAENMPDYPNQTVTAPEAQGQNVTGFDHMSQHNSFEEQEQVDYMD